MFAESEWPIRFDLGMRLQKEKHVFTTKENSNHWGLIKLKQKGDV